MMPECVTTRPKIAVVITHPGFHGHMVPLGYLYVIATLKKAGAPVTVIQTPGALDESSGAEGLCRQLRQIEPDLVITGTSYKFHNNCPSPTIRQALAVCGLAKSELPECTTLLIGPLNTVLKSYLLRQESVDALVLGEPEEICQAVVHGMAENRPLTQVRGLALRTPKGVQDTGPSPYPDLDGLPFPDRESIQFSDYIYNSYFSPRTTELLSSRGCPFDCTYCFGARTSRRHAYNHGPSFRAASAERVVEEIDLLYHRWGVRGIKFSDVEFCVSLDRVRAICQLILTRGYPGLAWRAVTRATSVEPALLKLMYDAGCRNIYYGVESGDPDVLAAMHKKVTMDEIREAFRQTRACGIKPEASFLLGVPGETEASIQRTIRFAFELDPFLATFHVFVPFPGIPMERDLETISDANLDEWDVYQLRGRRSYCEVPAERLDELSKKAYRSFYFRPRFLARIALQLREASVRKYLISLALGRNEGSWLRRMLVKT